MGAGKKEWISEELSPGGGHLYSKVDVMLEQENTWKGLFFPTVDVHGTLKRVSRTAKFGKKGMFFNPWNFYMCLGYNTQQYYLLFDYLRNAWLDNITWKGYT